MCLPAIDKFAIEPAADASFKAAAVDAGTHEASFEGKQTVDVGTEW